MGSTSVSCADQVCMGWLGEGSRTGNLVDSMARTTKKSTARRPQHEPRTTYVDMPKHFKISKHFLPTNRTHSSQLCSKYRHVFRAVLPVSTDRTVISVL